MSRPLVSVVIATYNAGAYLSEAIASVLRQSVTDLEVVVIDDGSTDNTRELVSQIKDERLHYFWQANAGQTSAKNHGIRRTKGQFIGFCDGDDYWYRDKLELQLPLMERSPEVGVVYSPADAIDQDGVFLDKTITSPFRGHVSHHLFMRNFVSFGTALVRHECFDRVGSFDSSLRMGIDWDLWLRISVHYQFDFVPKATYAYRIWGGQMSKNWRGRYSSAFRIMRKFVRENPKAVSVNLWRRGFADTYANRGRARAEEQPLLAITDGALAVVLDPFERYCWATFGRLVKDAVIPPQKTQTAVRNANSTYSLPRRVLRPATRAITARLPRIFAYHRFSTEDRPRAVSRELFAQQMQVLKERCEVVSLAELVSTPTSAGKPRAVVTVDDGYADFFQVAFPVLRDLGLRATVFVTTGFIDRQLFLWPDRIRALLESAAPSLYRLGDAWAGRQIALRTAEEREKAWNDLADQLVYSTTAARDAAISALAQALGIAPESVDTSAHEAMTWSELRELSAAGIEIGDHTFSHPSMSTLSDDELLSELGRSKSLLESNTGVQVRTFAYPNGTQRDFEPRMAQLLQQLGYEGAVLSIPQPISANQTYKLGRFPGDCSVQEFTSVVDGFGYLRYLR